MNARTENNRMTCERQLAPGYVHLARDLQHVPWSGILPSNA
jgi:hypothetical protein